MNDLSISMLIDSGINSDINNENKLLNEKKLHYWVNDRIIDRCIKCKKNFSLTLRKHHCRNCGKIFCYKCSNYFITIPDSVDVPRRNKYFNYNYYSDNNEERVCQNCYNNILELNNLKIIVNFFNLLKLDIIDYRIITIVCKTWNRIGSNYLNKFRNLRRNFGSIK